MTIAGPEELLAEGVWRITTPLPYRPRSVHAYLLRTERGLVLIDGGGDSPEAWEVLDAAVRRIAGKWAAVTLHLITHMHVDHVGLARRIHAASAAAVMMGRLDAERRDRAAADPLEEARYRADLLGRAGAPLPIIERMARPSGAPHVPDPSVTHRPEAAESEWEEVPGWTVVWTPGHTAGHLALFRPADRLLVSGDLLLPRVTPTIGVNRQREDPVGDYLDSLRRIERLRPRLALGGHGAAMPAPLERIVRLREEARAETERLHRMLGDDPVSPWSIVERRYAGRELPGVMWYQAVREVTAHLAHLVSAGRAELRPGDPDRYSATADLARGGG